MASHTTTNYTISQPTGVDGQVRLEAGTIDKTVSPEPAPVAPAAQPAVLPVAHTHAPGEEIDPKVIKQRKEQQKQYAQPYFGRRSSDMTLYADVNSRCSLEKELDREAQLDEKEIKAREKDAKGVSKEEEKAHDVSMCC
jgi:type IV secretory pathway VirB10-like protein